LGTIGGKDDLERPVMEMAQVRYFLALCNKRNFTRAARHSGVTQPSLTAGIKKLETEIGGPLFIRGKKVTELTELGRVLRPTFEEIDRLVDNVTLGGKPIPPRRRKQINGYAVPPSKAAKRSSKNSTRP